MNSSENQYDAIAEAYQDSKQLPFREYIEAHSLFEILGNIRGATVLDLACGDGFYTRQIKQAGALEVTGVDLSAEMIKLAEQEERTRPLGCKYLHPSQQHNPFWDAFMSHPPVIGFSAAKP